MKRQFAASVWREGNWYVSQCLEVDVASQGETEGEAMANFKEALELCFEPPHATRPILANSRRVARIGPSAKPPEKPAPNIAARAIPTPENKISKNKPGGLVQNKRFDLLGSLHSAARLGWPCYRDAF